MKARLIQALEPKALAIMPTKQLLGRLRSLQQCEESAALSDRTSEEIASSEGILFKNTPEWQSAYANLKAVLGTREHVPSAAERATARRKRVGKKSNKRAGGDGGIARLRRAERQGPAVSHHGR